MFKLVLEKAEEPEIKLTTFLGSSKKARTFQKKKNKKTYTSDLWTMSKPLTVWITTNCKILKQMGIPDNTCLLRNLYAGHQATIQTGHGITDWFQIVKGVLQGYILSPCLFNLYAKYIMWNVGLDETQKDFWEKINNLNMQMTPPSGRKGRSTKEPLDESERRVKTSA